MEILRRGGEHLEAREYWRWAALAALLLAVTVVVAAAVSPNRLVGLPVLFAVIGLLVAARPARKIAGRIRAARKGRLGERLVTQLLERLPDDYFLVNDVVLRAGNIDHVLTGPCGVVVIETKRVAGRIRCDGDLWTVNGRRIKSYSKQAKAGAIAVKTLLAARHPEFAREFVQAVVVVTEPRCELQIVRPEVAVVRFSQLLAYVVELGQVRRMDRARARIAARSLMGGVGVA
jgi:hypothetical protein